MNQSILQFSLENEMDVVLAHKRAIQLSELTGLIPSDQTRFATAVSEIARNCIEHAEQGEVIFSILKENGAFLLVAKIIDKGTGISGIEQYLSDVERDATKRGIGIANSKRLVNFFDVETSEAGTTVTLGKDIPENHPPINKIIVKGWAQHFNKEVDVSPYEEIKNRNIQLLELMDRFQEQTVEAELQLEENQRLSRILKRKNENLKQMAYLIAHDLRNPLNTISLSCEMFADEEHSEEDNQFISMIRRSASRMLNIIEGVQKNIEEDPDIPVAASQIDLKQVMEDLLEQFSSYLSKIDGEVVTNFEVKEFYYPQIYLYSILSNLLSNSIKYRSEQPLKVSIENRREGNEICFIYSDNGTGIDLKKHKKNLFKPFERLTSGGDGKGLGLSIVHHLISRNGGKITVDSEPGKGTTFTCYLIEYPPR